MFQGASFVTLICLWLLFVCDSYLFVANPKDGVQRGWASRTNIPFQNTHCHTRCNTHCNTHCNTSGLPRTLISHCDTLISIELASEASLLLFLLNSDAQFFVARAAQVPFLKSQLHSRYIYIKTHIHICIYAYMWVYIRTKIYW